jgi:replicative DNA helicase
MEQFSFAFAIVKNMASCGGQYCGIISIDKRLTRIGIESQCSFAKINLSRIESRFFSMEDWEKVTDAAEMLSGLPILIDDSHFCSAHQLIRRIKKWKKDKNVEFVIIDYLELISSNSFELTEVIRQLKILSKEIDVHIMIISHCDRKLEGRTNKRPLLSDLKVDGMHVYPDTIIFLYRDDIYNREEDNPLKGSAELIIAKNSHGETGSYMLKYLADSKTYENWPKKE